MDQEKIGKFISKCRKEKNMTQSELAERLGVTDRSISNWENGKNMPDVSLFKPLCSELGISVNELISGEHIKKEELIKKSEENILKTIMDTNKSKKINKRNTSIGIMIVGLFISIIAMSLFVSDSSWGSIYTVVGCIISLIGISKLTYDMKPYWKRLLVCLIYFILLITAFIFVDYLSVISIKQAPRFSYKIEYGENMIVYHAPFYKVYRVNRDTNEEYYVIGNMKEEDVPRSPFNRNKSGIENLKQYKTKYVGNNSKVGNLISNLPLSEYGYTFEIDSENLGLKINYHITDWYLKDVKHLYLEKSLVYNSVCLFLLIDNLEYIDFNFTGEAYHTTKENVKKNFTSFEKLEKLDEETFNRYLEFNLTINSFASIMFDKLFS